MGIKMTSTELWQIVMAQTEEEIKTGKYKVCFSKYEIYEFPKPHFLKKIRTKVWRFLMIKTEAIGTKLRLPKMKATILRLSRAYSV